MILCYTHKSEPYLVIVREASIRSRCEQMQRPTARQYVKRESKWEVSIKSLPSELRKFLGGVE